jgi:subtilisin family serine protease
MRHYFNPTHFLRNTAFVFLIMLASNVSAAKNSPRLSAITPGCAAPGETVSIEGRGFGAKNVAVTVGILPAEVSQATGHSAEFTVPTDAQPGFTSVTTLNPGGQGDSIDFQVKGSEVCGNEIDDDCDGGVDEVDECPLASVEIDTSPFDITLAPGETGNISTGVSFTAPSSEDFTIEVTQQIVALSGDSNGISISPDVVGGFISSTDKYTVDNQEITAYSDGVYEITTTAEIVETGESVSSAARVTVTSNSQTFALGIPGSIPSGLAPETITSVLFTAQVQGADITPPTEVVLGGDIDLTLNDQGMDGDLAADDGTFSGTTDVDTAGLAAGTCISVFASATQGADNATSGNHTLCISSLPLELAPSDMTNTVNDPESGEDVIADEVLISIEAGTSDEVIEQIAASVDGTVAGSIPGLNVYQIQLKKPVSNISKLNQIISNLKKFEEVSEAEWNGIDKGDAITPSDSKFSSQKALTHIRADEAWTIARGGVMIAIVDSGVDLDHPDLSSKIVKGKDFVNGGDPDDEYGHGTHVAGIAAALTNNSKGIAGVSWGSKILVVRVTDSTNSAPGSRTAEGIKEAADGGARIINVSISGLSAKTEKCKAVSYAISKGSMVITSAGNKGNSTKRYPAACAGAIAVGNTTLSDARASTSNFGSWVDIAAPGTGILSTVPVGGTCKHCNKSLSGTSMAAPMVAGAAAVVLSREPKLTNAQVETRLKRTAVKLSKTAQLGAGRIDLFEAVFNGSFEEGNLALWDTVGTASSTKTLGSIKPQDRERMGSVSTGPAGAQTAGTLSQSFIIQPGVTSFPISFKYAFVTEEYPEWVGSIYDDSLKIKLITPSGSEILLAEESVNGSSFTAIEGIDFPGGDTTVGWTGWKSVSKSVPVTAGSGTYRIFLEDAGDSVYDTEIPRRLLTR